MNIIELAKEAGLLADDGEVWLSPYQEAMERFAALVAAHERDKAKGVFEELEREVKEELINAINCAVEIEREQCAKVAFDKAPSDESACEIAAAIRARSEK